MLLYYLEKIYQQLMKQMHQICLKKCCWWGSQLQHSFGKEILTVRKVAIVTGIDKWWVEDILGFLCSSLYHVVVSFTFIMLPSLWALTLMQLGHLATKILVIYPWLLLATLRECGYSLRKLSLGIFSSAFYLCYFCSCILSFIPYLKSLWLM